MVTNEPPPSAPRLSHSKINLAREPSEARVQARETMHSQAESTGQALGLWTQSGFMEVRGHGGQARLILVLKVSLCRTQVQARVSFSSKHRKVRGKISSFAINFGSSWAHSNKPSRRDCHWVEGQPPPASREHVVPFTSSRRESLQLASPRYSLRCMGLGVCSTAFFQKTCLFAMRLCNIMETSGILANRLIVHFLICIQAGLRPPDPWKESRSLDSQCGRAGY